MPHEQAAAVLLQVDGKARVHWELLGKRLQSGFIHLLVGNRGDVWSDAERNDLQSQTAQRLAQFQSHRPQPDDGDPSWQIWLLENGIAR